MVNRIAFCGPPDSGKSLASKFLETKGYFRKSFSDEIKLELVTALCNGVPKRYPHYYKQMQNNHKMYRRLLQEWGEMRRLEDPEYWLHPIYNFIVNHHTLPIVIDSLRTQEEFDFLKKCNFTIVALDFPNNHSHRLEHEYEGFRCDVYLNSFELLHNIDNFYAAISEVAEIA